MCTQMILNKTTRIAEVYNNSKYQTTPVQIQHNGKSGTADWISLIQSLSVSSEAHSFPKSPLCHELSLYATLLSIDLLATRFLFCFDVIVFSEHGRFQIKLWRVWAFKLVISGDYLAAAEFAFLFFFWPQTGLCDCALQKAVSNAHRWYAAAMNPLHWGGDLPRFSLGRALCGGFHELYHVVQWKIKV